MLHSNTQMNRDKELKMNNSRIFSPKLGTLQYGFTLIEAMVAFSVAAVGLLAVTSLQINLISTSGESKARSEALILAQQKIEEFRNYTASSQSEFFSGDLANVDDTETANDESITGTNALFSRDYTIAASTSGETKSVAVTVGWTDSDGDSQVVTLNTNITWISPRVLATEVEQLDSPRVPSATGRAHLGEGEYTTGMGSNPTDNDDKTRTVDYGDDRILVDCGNNGCADGDTIVLTLEDACAIADQECTDFVRIQGTVYIDRDTQNTLNAETIYLKASDAAYCQRYYTDSGSVMAIDSSTNNGDLPETSSNSSDEYTYFNYTCYLGGGWHGNIGIILGSGNTTRDKFCQGDPYETADLTKPVIANRRAYRGMLYKTCTVGDDNCSAGGITTIVDEGTTRTRYWSQGVGDGITITGHDYVIASATPSTTDGSFCGSFTLADGSVTDGPMTREDSKTDDLYPAASPDGDDDEGSMFRGNPADFFCLNEEEGHLNLGSKCVAGAAGVGETACNYHLDTFTSPETANYTCPYDPTDPPNYIYTASGSLSAETKNLVWGDTDSDADTEINDTLVVETPSGDCTFTTPTESAADTACIADGNTNCITYLTTYECEIYDWDPQGWDGYINVTESLTDLTCSPESTTYADANGTEVSASIDDSTTPSTPTIVCEEGIRFTMSGNISYYTPQTSYFTDAVDGEVTMLADAANGGNGTCTITGGGTSYSCTSGLMDPGTTTWTGSITITSNDTTDFSCYMGDVTLTPRDDAATDLVATPGTRTQGQTVYNTITGDLIGTLASTPDDINYIAIDALTNYTSEDLYIDGDSTCDAIDQ